MKLSFYSLVIATFFLIACTDNGNKTSHSTIIQDAAAEPVNISTSLELPPIFNKYDCGSCHRLNEKLQGPSYEEIAAKYHAKTNAAKYLSDKIIKGGSGVWGSVPMNAHPAMPASDATELATYILSLHQKAPIN
jgi:cytochrome c